MKISDVKYNYPPRKAKRHEGLKLPRHGNAPLFWRLVAVEVALAGLALYVTHAIGLW